MLYDFLAFRTMVTPSILLIVYYFGAAGMPLAVYMLFRRLRRSVTGENGGEENGAETMRWSWRLRALFLLFFLAGELAWRIFIEFFVAYFQIRAALAG